MGRERQVSAHCPTYCTRRRAMPFASSQQRLTEHYRYTRTAPQAGQSQRGMAERLHTCLCADPCLLGSSRLQTSTPASRRHTYSTPQKTIRARACAFVPVRYSTLCAGPSLDTVSTLHVGPSTIRADSCHPLGAAKGAEGAARHDIYDIYDLPQSYGLREFTFWHVLQFQPCPPTV
jgi:hypothetical protein